MEPLKLAKHLFLADCLVLAEQVGGLRQVRRDKVDDWQQLLS